MSKINDPLASLIRQLDKIQGETTLTQLAGVIRNAHLAVEDVLPFVHETQQKYHRGLVVRREHYELLVLTWLPGHSSCPHDHSGSISAMLVLHGEAAEGCWRVASDGYVDLEFENRLKPGDLTAWQDAGVHTVRNASPTERLVTLHVYAPILRDVRRFVPRPDFEYKQTLTSPEGETPTVVVIGGGFSGTMAAAQLLRQADQAQRSVHVCLVERQGAIGEGLAYSTTNLNHLLNVPAGRMSAWADRPDDFMNWASRRYGAIAPSDFLPRKWYGEYVRESLIETSRTVGDNVRLTIAFDEVRRLFRHPDGGWMVSLGGNAAIPAAVAVLAIGHRPPSDVVGPYWTGPRTRLISDPWKLFSDNAIQPHDSVVVLGSGLTAVDIILSLCQQRRQAPITLISRRGLVPQSHLKNAVPPVDLETLVAELTHSTSGIQIRTLCSRLRKLIKEKAEQGIDWRGVVDGLRPHTQALWKALTRFEQERFLKRLRPYWEIHRHRMAWQVAERFSQLRADGQIEIIAGNVVAAQAQEEEVRMLIRKRGHDRSTELHTRWVINCTGPTASNFAEANPVIGSLLVHDWVQPDELSLGLKTDDDGCAIDASGHILEDLIVVGTLRKPASWESTAVPELRSQAETAAKHILRHLASSRFLLSPFPPRQQHFF